MQINVLLGVVIMVVISAVVYPLVGDNVDNLTNESHEDYAGADNEAIISMIPLFYWLGIALVVIGVAITAMRDSF